MRDVRATKLEQSHADTLDLLRRIAWDSSGGHDAEPTAAPEWLVTNGLGGYASGTVAGAITRRFHGFLVAAHPAPLGRLMLFNYVAERLRFPDGSVVWLNAYPERGMLAQAGGSPYLTEFRLESGMPIWRYTLPHAIVERSLLMPHGQNTVHLTYQLVSGDRRVELTLRPLVGFRRHDAPLEKGAGQRYDVVRHEHGVEVHGAEEMPVLRFMTDQSSGDFTVDAAAISDVQYLVEERRGYDHTGSFASPGFFSASLTCERPLTLIASTESWDTTTAVAPDEAARLEHHRRARLVQVADIAARDGAPAELVLAADQFIISPATRPDEEVRSGSDAEARTVIAGYHWFTDWGRDTMIALEGLTLVTGRHHAAKQILLTFAQHVRDGLIPNLFPEGERDGLYHTADATMWLFHAIDRYEHWTHDRSLVDELLPILEGIVGRHVSGTLFGIRMDDDGLLAQGAEGYQLTWMDAKVDGWVVTPRRGKTVEINALWYNALCLVAGWLERSGRSADARTMNERASRTRAAFNERFWSDERGHLFDVVDGEHGDDPACRPNQLLALSLPHPVLDVSRWTKVLEVVRTRLLTPRGLRSLAPGHPDYKPRYLGDLRTRDAAYHQGTVWSWLIGPFIDAWLALHPDDRDGARAVLTPMLDQLDEGCIGSVSEIFDGDPPFASRGCIAQAWSVAELLRSLVRTTPTPTPADEERT